MPKKIAPKPAGYGDDDMTRPTGWDALLDDLFGLNVRALATLWVAFTQPSKLFTAARDPDWLNKYTPSIRLVFSLIAVVVFLKFIWMNDASGLFAFARQNFETIAMEFPGMSLDEATREYLAIQLVTYPFAYFGVHLLFALFLRIWGAGTPLPVRIRLYFVTVLPTMLMGVVSTVLFGIMTLEQLGVATTVGLAVMTGVYLLVLLSGLKPVHPAPGARVWRSVVGASVLLMADLMVGLMASLWAVTWLMAGAG